MHGRGRGSRSQWPMRLALFASLVVLFSFSKTTSEVPSEIDISTRSRSAYRRQGLESTGVSQQMLSSTASANSKLVNSKATIDDSFLMHVADDDKGNDITSKEDDDDVSKLLIHDHTANINMNDDADDDDEDGDDESTSDALTAAAQKAAAYRTDASTIKAAKASARHEEYDAADDDIDAADPEEDDEDDDEQFVTEDDVEDDEEDDQDSDFYKYKSSDEPLKKAPPLESASVSAARQIELTKPFNPNRFSKNTTFLEALATCDTLTCIHDAHYQPKAGAKYNFPDFFIIGWQKTATTSLYSHLARHQHVMTPTTKEPEILTIECGYNLTTCPEHEERQYIKRILRQQQFIDAGGQMPMFEASTHIVRGEDRLPEFSLQMKEYFPWTKLIASIREPISRSISMLVHLKDKGTTNGGGCLTKNTMGWCLLNKSQVTKEWNPLIPTNYSYPLQRWLDLWPREQIFLIQYEELTTEEFELETLRNMKMFVGVDPELPRRQELPLVNSRKFQINPEGHSVRKEDYEALIEIVRPDVDRVMALVERYKLGNATRWRANWERVWQNNLNSCDENGDCMIQLS